ncbi:uncharacterized protein LOC107423697 [Ziziphus jujuba]|uniref:Uncharacterized protein LOC107423697 n=1 Tax=Ziziphus jujuba TaxID=326968 RepID=A0ABM3IUV3_ZIZJJ|nr:uncharacterized protein LOC107423697 [Ziziphus jujuba]
MGFREFNSRIQQERHEEAFWSIFMGFFRRWHSIIWVTFFLSFSSSVQASSIGYDPKSLNAFFVHHANRSIVKPHTGILYTVPLPANFTGMELTFVRLRSGSLRNRGANFSSFYIPPKVRAHPHVVRLALVYENLGNWSSYYYHVPNHSLVAPVVGFTVFDSPGPYVIGTQKLNFSFHEEPISIWFPRIELQGGNVTPKCVKFGSNGSFEISSMSKRNGCITRSQGHFSLVIPFPPPATPPRRPPPPPPPPQRAKKSYWKWWVLGFAGGVIGLVLIVLIVIAVSKLVKKKKLKAMETQSEKSVPLDAFWIGRSKMPSASMIRTQPALEHGYVP